MHWLVSPLKLAKNVTQQFWVLKEKPGDIRALLFEEQKGAGRPFFFQKVLLHFLWAEQLKLPSNVCWKMLSLKGETMEGSVLRLLYNQVIPCLQTLSHVCSQRPCAKNKMLFNFDSLRWWKTFESDQFKKMKLIQGIVFFLVNDNKYARGLISN